MEELQDREEELQELIEIVEGGINSLDKLKGSLKDEKIEYVRNRLSRLKTVLHSYNVETREIPKNQQTPFIEKSKEFQETINSLLNKLNWIEKDEGGSGGSQHIENMTGDEMVNVGSEIQKDDVRRLKKMEETVASTQQVGTNILDTMAENREKLNMIDDGVDTVANNLKLARRQISEFARKVATDKIILGFLVLLFIGIVAAIIFSVIEDDQDITSINRDSFVPDNL